MISIGSPAVLALALLVARSLPALAQERGDTAALSPVVVTATRVSTPQAAATSSSTVLSGDALRERGVATVADALQGLPGVAVARSGSTGGTTSLFLRGGENDYVQVLVDGVAINEPGGYVDLASLTTENVERIEVVRGPASVLYGSEAVAGVVQIFTRAGKGAPRASAGARVGSYGTLDADAAAEGTTGPAAWSLAAARYATDGILAFNNDYRNDVVSALLRTAGPSRGDARASVRYSDGTFHFPTDAAGTPYDSNQFSFERRLIAGAELGRQITERFEARLVMASSDVDAGTRDEPDNSSTPFRSRSGRESYRRSGDARLLFRPGAATVFSLGSQLEWEREETSFRFEDLTPGQPSGFESNHTGRRWNRAYYAQGVGSASALSYTAGLRLEEDQTFGRYATWRVGTGLRLAGGTRLRAAAGKGFKRPSISEITGGGFASPNFDLQPERSLSWEVGGEREAAAAGHLLIGATYFDQRFRDLVQYQPVSPTVQRYENLAKARARGVELEGRLRQHASLEATLAYTYLDTKVEDAGADLAGATFKNGARLLRRPAHEASAGVTWRALVPLSLHGALLFVGARDDRRFAGGAGERVELPSYTKLDLAATYDVPRSARLPRMTFTARVDNALDRRYESIAGFESPGRVVTVGARLGVGY